MLDNVKVLLPVLFEFNLFFAKSDPEFNGKLGLVSILWVCYQEICDISDVLDVLIHIVVQWLGELD